MNRALKNLQLQKLGSTFLDMVYAALIRPWIIHGKKNFPKSLYKPCMSNIEEPSFKYSNHSLIRVFKFFEDEKIAFEKKIQKGYDTP